MRPISNDLLFRFLTHEMYVTNNGLEVVLQGILELHHSDMTLPNLNGFRV